MDKFWNWMKTKNYIDHYGDFKIQWDENDYTLIDKKYIPKQMLVGFMIEYLFFMGYDTEILQMREHDNHNIDDYYEYLENKIKKDERIVI